MSARLYLDYMATTPLDPRVRAAMMPFLEEDFGNPHSDHHYGWRAAGAIDQAAVQIAKLINADASEIVFTSGATEANNMAVQGVCRSNTRRGNHIIVSSIEHKCVLNAALHFVDQEFDVEMLPVGSTGIVDVELLASRLRPDTALVSIMLANNEIGALQPVAEIGRLCRERGIVCHSDAAQAVGKIPVDVEALNVDLLSISAHKLYGPKGAGALYISDGCPVELTPLTFGGAQQNGRRAGTLSPFLCVGLGEACRLATELLPVELADVARLRALLIALLRAAFPNCALNGDEERSLNGCVSMRLPGIDAESLLTALHGKLAVSSSSACNAGLIEPSYVLMALGLSLEEANSTIRFGFGRFTTEEEIERAASLIVQKVGVSKRFSLAG